MPKKSGKSEITESDKIKISITEIAGILQDITNFNEKLSVELTPLLDKLRAKPKDELQCFKDAFLKFKSRNDKSAEKVSFILSGELEHKLGKSSSVNSQIVDLFFYLGLVESLGNCYVDILVMLVIMNGRDFHIESRFSTPRIKHVTSIDDLEKEKVPLTIKLNFLEDNGIKSFAKIIDSKLRNDIAHLNFEVNKDKVVIKGKPIEGIVSDSFTNFMLATVVVDDLLHSLAFDFGWEKEHKTLLEDLMLKLSNKMKNHQT